MRGKHGDDMCCYALNQIPSAACSDNIAKEKRRRTIAIPNTPTICVTSDIRRVGDTTTGALIFEVAREEVRVIVLGRES